MSRPAVAAVCVVVLVAGFVAGRASRSGSGAAEIVTETVEHPVVISAQHVGSAQDPRDAGPFDIARVASARRGAILQTTIVTRQAWRASLLRHVELRIVYDVNDDGRADRHEIFFLLHGRLESWISDFTQGIQGAELTRRNATTITAARDASIFYAASGQARLLTTSPIGVAVIARWPGGQDRVPNRGWIIVPPPTTP